MILESAIEEAYFRALECNENYDIHGAPIWHRIFGDVQCELQPDNHSQVEQIDGVLHLLADSYYLSKNVSA